MAEIKTSYTQVLPVHHFSAEHYTSPYNHDFDIGKRKPSFSFLYIVKGNVTFHTNSENISGTAGDFFYIPYGIRYNSRWYGETGTEHYCIHCYINDSEQLFLDPYALQKVSALSTPESLNDILDIYHALEKQESSTTIIKNFFILYEKILPNLKKAIPKEYPELLLQATNYIKAHYKEPLTVPNLALILNTSESTLYHIFQKNLRTTPIKYYNRVRLEKVIHEMATKDSIEDIAYRNGFDSYGYFRELFKAYTGLTPKQYRQQKYGSHSFAKIVNKKD